MSDVTGQLTKVYVTRFRWCAWGEDVPRTRMSAVDVEELDAARDPVLMRMERDNAVLREIVSECPTMMWMQRDDVGMCVIQLPDW